MGISADQGPGQSRRLRRKWGIPYGEKYLSMLFGNYPSQSLIPGLCRKPESHKEGDNAQCPLALATQPKVLCFIKGLLVLSLNVGLTLQIEIEFRRYKHSHTNTCTHTHTGMHAHTQACTCTHTANGFVAILDVCLGI